MSGIYNYMSCIILFKSHPVFWIVAHTETRKYSQCYYWRSQHDLTGLVLSLLCPDNVWQLGEGNIPSSCTVLQVIDVTEIKFGRGRGVEDRAGGQQAFFLVIGTVTIVDSEQLCQMVASTFVALHCHCGNRIRSILLLQPLIFPMSILWEQKLK